MKFSSAFVTCTFLTGAAAFAWMKLNPPKPEPTRAEMIERGAYLVKLGGCAECHTPKVMTAEGLVDDESRAFSGHPADLELESDGEWGASIVGMTAWSGAWGVSYASNLTPDKATGLFSEAVFISAMKTGKKRGIGRDILPPMPWQSLGQSSDADLKAIYAYLRSLPPVHNSVPEPTPPANHHVSAY